MRKIVVSIVALSLATLSGTAVARDNIQVVGSSTVYPFATVVAEKFGKSTEFKTPIIESTGSGGGMKLFCAGVGKAHPDFTNASRRIKKSEFDQCQANGVTDIVEIKIGYDGIVMANSKKTDQISLTRRDIYLALAKEVPNSDGSDSLIPNPYSMWSEVNSSLPAVKIEVVGPPPTSGTRDAFVELAMEGGCNTFDWIAAMKKQDRSAYKSICHTIREDGSYVEAGENDNLIVQKLEKNPAALGIFGFSFLDQNSDLVQGSLVDGVDPEFELIADGSYPVSRPLYMYAKAAHFDTVPGIVEFLQELTDEDTWGDDGYLADRGLIPMPEEERDQFREATESRIPLSM
ncbi:MAG: PstS family phosphate ABC transporter substrate-binding protein [Pseudomonadota bacterium]